MQVQEKIKRIETKTVTILLETDEDYKEYLEQFEEEGEESILYWLDDIIKADCSPNHNTWSGRADKDGAKFSLKSDVDGSNWKLEVKKARTLA